MEAELQMTKLKDKVKAFSLNPLYTFYRLGWAVPLMYSCLISSTSLPIEIFIFSSTACLFCQCHHLQNIQHSRSHYYLIIFFFHSSSILLSQITLDSHLHPLHPACTLFFTSLIDCLLLWMVESRYSEIIDLHFFYSVQLHCSLYYSHTSILPHFY